MQPYLACFTHIQKKLSETESCNFFEFNGLRTINTDFSEDEVCMLCVQKPIKYPIPNC